MPIKGNQASEFGEEIAEVVNISAVETSRRREVQQPEDGANTGRSTSLLLTVLTDG